MSSHNVLSVYNSPDLPCHGSVESFPQQKKKEKKKQGLLSQSKRLISNHKRLITKGNFWNSILL